MRCVRNGAASEWCYIKRGRISAMMIREAYAMLAERLTRAGVPSPDAESWQLLESVTGVSRTELMVAPRKLSTDEQRQLGEWIGRRGLREPLQLIIGRSHFYGLTLATETGVLIPRPETERLVELTLEAITRIPEPLVLDVGAGSGAIALAVKNERRDARVMATDICADALDLSRRNAHELGLEVELVVSDLLESPAVLEFARRAHVLVSNPPYLPAADRLSPQPEVRWEPEQALYAGEDGLAVFRKLLSQAHEALEPGALMLLELDPRNVYEAEDEADDWQSANVYSDLVGRPRFLALRR